MGRHNNKIYECRQRLLESKNENKYMEACGYIGEVMAGPDALKVKLSKVGAMIKALESIGR